MRDHADKRQEKLQESNTFFSVKNQNSSSLILTDLQNSKSDLSLELL